MDQKKNDPPKKPDDNGKKPRNIWATILMTVAIILVISSIYNMIVGSQYNLTTYSDFIHDKQAGKLHEVEIRYDRVIYLTKEEAAKPAGSQKASYTGLPIGGDYEAMAQELIAQGVTVTNPIVEDNSFIMMILSYVIMFGIIFFFSRMITKRMGSDGMMGGFGKSRAKVYMEKKTGVTFKDVAGQDEAKESLQEIIDFLHNPQKYAEIGAKLPKGDRKSVV